MMQRAGAPPLRTGCSDGTMRQGSESGPSVAPMMRRFFAPIAWRTPSSRLPRVRERSSFFASQRAGACHAGGQALPYLHGIEVAGQPAAVVLQRSTRGGQRRLGELSF